MADIVEEINDDDWSEAMTEAPNTETSQNNSTSEVSKKNSQPQLPVESDTHILQTIPKVDTTIQNTISFQLNNSAMEKVEDNDNKKPVAENLRKQPRSECRTRSRNTHKCQKQFQEMIGKHEIRNEKLEQQEGDLRQRLQTLECSMPAVMVWNICRMAEGAPTSAVRRLMEKQFQGYGADNMTVPATPSQHWDARVRKIEAERKEALRRTQEARALLTEKEIAVHERRKQLEEAKKCNQERKEKMEKLAREAAELKEALKNAGGDDNSCETGECGEIRCKEKWLGSVGSVSSIGSTDLECFAKLQELAEAEICMKRQITELERREEAYMRTLQQADEMWSKMEGDTADTVSELQDQLELKIAANQKLADRICQLEDEVENLKKKLMSSKDVLSKLTDKEYSDAKIGLDHGEATVKDFAIIAAVKTATKSAMAVPNILEQESLAYPETIDEESSIVAPEYNNVGVNAFPKMSDKSSEAIPAVDQIHRGLDPVTGLGIEASVGDEEAPEYSDVGLSAFPKLIHKSSEAIAVANQIHRGLDPVTGLKIDECVGDDEDIPEHWKNWNWDEGCPPDTICDGMLENSTVTDDVLSKDVRTFESKVQTIPEMSNFVADVPIRRTVASELKNPVAVAKVTGIAMKAAETELENDQIILSREELRNWYNIMDSVHHMIAKCDDCSSKTEDIAQLAEKIKLHLRIKGLAGVKGPIIMEKTSEEQVIISDEQRPELRTPSRGEMRQEIKPAILVDRGQLRDKTESYIPEGVAKNDSSDEGVLQVNPEVAEDVKIPAETTEIIDILTIPVPIDAETTSPEIFDKITSTDKLHTDLKQPAVVDHEMSIPIEQLPRVEKQSKDETAGFITDVKTQEEPDVIPYDDSFTEASTETLEKLEGMLPVSMKVEDESQETTKPSENLSPTESQYTSAVDFGIFIPGDEAVDKLYLEETNHIQEIDISIEMPRLSSEEAEKILSISKEVLLELEDSTEQPEQPIKISSEHDDIKSNLELDITTEDDATIEKPIPSFVTPRITSLSRVDVQPEIADEIPSVANLKDDLQSLLNVTPKRPSSEDIASEELKARLSKMGDVPEDTKEMTEMVPQVSELVKYEELKSDKVSVTKTVEGEDGPTLMDGERSSKLEPVTLTAQDGDFQAVSGIPEERSHPNVKEIEQVPDKLTENISTEEQILTVPDRAIVGIPYLAIAKVESLEKLQLPKSVDSCICKPHTCPLLDRSTGEQSKRKVLRVATDRTQTAPPVPKTSHGRMDKQKLKTISESTWPSPEVGMYRRATIWPRRPKDKSTLTTVCVDTQTDSALIRGRITLEGITRKDDCTCSGVCPRKTEHGGCIQRICKRPPGEKRHASVSRAVAELFGTSKLPMSVTSSAEKEIAAVRYTSRSLVPQNSELQCVECGRPMSPEGTPQSTNITLPTSSQKSITSSLKKMMSSISRVAYKNGNFVCCECKTSGKLKTASGSNLKIPNKKDLDKRSCDRDMCCFCPSEIYQKTSSKTSKKKKRKPERKDQAVMANISRSTVKGFSKQPNGIDIIKIKSPVNTASKTKYTDIKVVSKVSNLSEKSYCECEEFSNDPSIAIGENTEDFSGHKTPKEKVSCDCFLSESVSKGSSCNCIFDTN